MSEANQLINKLEQGVDALLKKVSELNVTVKNQTDEVLILKKMNENLKEENSLLSDNVDNLNEIIQLTESSSDKSGEYKSRISELVNEIDSCISLLNG